MTLDRSTFYNPFMSNIHVEIRGPLLRWLDDAARRLDVKRAWVIRKALERGIAEMAKSWGMKPMEGRNESNRLHQDLD